MLGLFLTCLPALCFFSICDERKVQSALYIIAIPLSTVGYTSVAASVIHSRQRSN